MREYGVLILVMYLLLPVSARASDDAGPLKLTGALVQGGLVTGRVEPGARVKLGERPVMVAKTGHFVIGFGRDAALQQTLTLTLPGGARVVHALQLEDRDFPIERIDGLPPKMVTPPPEWAARRKIETGRVRVARAPRTEDLHWLEGFVMPATGRISGVYGSQRILNGQPRSPHYGIDIANKTGTPVVAPAGGTVTLAAPDFLLEGGIIIIDHGFGVSSTLFHLASVEVAEGDVVRQGAQIGTVGATGRATGPHVDWRVNWGDVRIDPTTTLGDALGDALGDVQ